MDDKTARKRLELLQGEEGALKIILPFHACAKGNVTDQQMAAAGPDSDLGKACAAYAEKHGHAAGQAGGYRDPGHYLMVPVARIEEARNNKDWITAYADDEGGSRVSGSPAAVLSRLTEHERG